MKECVYTREMVAGGRCQTRCSDSGAAPAGFCTSHSDSRADSLLQVQRTVYRIQLMAIRATASPAF